MQIEESLRLPIPTRESMGSRGIRELQDLVSLIVHNKHQSMIFFYFDSYKNVKCLFTLTFGLEAPQADTVVETGEEVVVVVVVT